MNKNDSKFSFFSRVDQMRSQATQNKSHSNRWRKFIWFKSILDMHQNMDTMAKKVDRKLMVSIFSVTPSMNKIFQSPLGKRLFAVQASCVMLYLRKCSFGKIYWQLILLKMQMRCHRLVCEGSQQSLLIAPYGQNTSRLAVCIHLQTSEDRIEG